MGIQVYKPNKANKGYAASFSYSEKDDAVFASILKQFGWDEVNQNGQFKESKNDPNLHVNVKLSFEEAGGILDCIERGRDFNQYHDFEETPKQISFKVWRDKEDPKIQKGYSFSITVSNKNDQSKNSFYIGLTFGEARLLREFLIHSIHQHFTKTNARQLK